MNGHRTRDEYLLKGPQTGGECTTSACVATYLYDGRDRLVREANGRAQTIDYTRLVAL